MFRLPGAGASPDKAALEEEKRRNRKNVWFTMKAFVAYVALLRLGKLKESSEESFSILKNENVKMKEPSPDALPLNSGLVGAETI